MADVVVGRSLEVEESEYSKKHISVSPLPTTEPTSKLHLNVVAVVVKVEFGQQDLDDGEVILLDYGVDFEIDLCLDEQDADGTSRDEDALVRQLSRSISYCNPGAFSSPATFILRDARGTAAAAAADGGRDDAAVRVHMSASITLYVDADDAEARGPAVDDEDYYVEPAFVAASKSSIEKLERVRVVEDSRSTCSVCIEEIEVGSEAVRMPCRHLYHEGCIVEWLEKSRVCPLCRFPVPAD